MYLPAPDLRSALQRGKVESARALAKQRPQQGRGLVGRDHDHGLARLKPFQNPEHNAHPGLGREFAGVYFGKLHG
jgi:hypothetical protein